MTPQEEFVWKHLHEMEGWLLDAAIQEKTGSPLSKWLKGMREKIIARLSLIYNELQPPVHLQPKPAVNGTATPQQRKVS